MNAAGQHQGSVWVQPEHKELKEATFFFTRSVKVVKLMVFVLQVMVLFDII